MAIDYTTAALIADVKRRITIPTSQSLFPDSDLLEVLTRELHATVVPFYVSLREDFFKTHTDTACDGTTTSWAIPSRAIGQKLIDVNLVQAGGSYQRLVLVDAEQITIGNGYWIEGSQITVYTAPTSSNSLRMSWLRRPNYLIASTSAAQITSINTGTNTVTCSTVPTGYSTSTPVDFIQNVAPFASLRDDATPTAVVTGASGTIQFASLPTGLAVGDWVSPQFQSPIPQIPPEAHNYLAVCAGAQVLFALGAMTEYQGIEAKRREMEVQISKISAPRVDNDQRRIINKPFGTMVRSWGGRLY